MIYSFFEQTNEKMKGLSHGKTWHKSTKILVSLKEVQKKPKNTTEILLWTKKKS